MNILLLHQNFPGQFLHVAAVLQATDMHNRLALTAHTSPRSPIIPTRTYQWRSPNKQSQSGLAANYAAWASRGTAVADALPHLRTEGYAPDAIVGHGGWGETLFVRDIWPNVPILLHAEFFDQAQGADVGVDPETADPDPVRAAYLIRGRRVPMLQALADATQAVTSTDWQASTFPAFLRSRIDVIHEGIDTSIAAPDASASLSLRRDGVNLRAGDEIV
jgi:hypothetical protein